MHNAGGIVLVTGWTVATPLFPFRRNGNADESPTGHQKSRYPLGYLLFILYGNIEEESKEEGAKASFSFCIRGMYCYCMIKILKKSCTRDTLKSNNELPKGSKGDFA